MYPSSTASRTYPSMPPSADHRSTVYQRNGSTALQDAGEASDTTTPTTTTTSNGTSAGTVGSTAMTGIPYAVADKEFPPINHRLAAKKRSQRMAVTNQATTSSSSASTRVIHFSQQHKTFAYLFLGCIAVLGSIQFSLNALLFESLQDEASGQMNAFRRFAPRGSLQEQVDALQARIRRLQEAAHLYSRDTADPNFYAFSIRDSRRLVPTQLPPELHVWDYVDISSQNQQRTRQASLFHNAQYQAPAVCQKYDLYCYKKKILQVFELVLEQNPHTEFFFYMEADNELCVPLVEIQRIALQYQRYFITTGIGFSGWIMRRDFVMDFLHALEAFRPAPRNPKDILNKLGPPPSEGPDPIAADFLSRNNSWAVTRQYLVSHSIQPSLGIEALTVRMPTPGANPGTSVESLMAGALAFGRDVGKQAMAPVAVSDPHERRLVGGGVGLKSNHTIPGGIPVKKNLDKHLPRCFEPRRSKWRISKLDHRDRFGWDYFDYDHCQGQELFPCYEGQLQELLAQDMILFNYTQLDLDRQKLIQKDEERQRKRLAMQGKHIAPIAVKNHPPKQDGEEQDPHHDAQIITPPGDGEEDAQLGAAGPLVGDNLRRISSLQHDAQERLKTLHRHKDDTMKQELEPPPDDSRE